MRLFVCTVAASFLSVGCAQSGDSTNKELAAIQQELARIRAENAIMMARLEAVEKNRERQDSRSSAPPSAPKADDDRPKLDVLRLSPTPEPTSTNTKDDAIQDSATPPGVEPDEPRPVIRSTGRGEVIAQSPQTPKKPLQPPRPATNGSGTGR